MSHKSLRLIQQLFLTTIITLFLIVIQAIFVYAQDPGDLDTTFNGTGIVTTTLSSDLDIGDGIAVQSDGKIVVAGTENDKTLAVIRYNSDGSLDTTFNGSGFVTDSTLNYPDNQAVAIQPDGKLVVATSSFGFNTSDVTILRYTLTGTLDSDFKGTGIVTTSVGSGSSGNAVAVANNKITVAGYGDNHFAVVRYNNDGTLDTDFNGTGIVTTPIGTISDGLDVAIHPDNGKIVVVGITEDNPNNDFAVVRYNDDGTLDTTFNGTGVVTTSISADNDIAYGVALQPDGKIVVAGLTGPPTGIAIVVARYTITGTLDTTLNSTGVVTTLVGQQSAAADVVIQPDGKIVAGGVVVENGQSRFVLVRYDNAGNLDTTFNSTGIVTTTIDQNALIGRALTIQPDNKLLMTGFSEDGSSNSDIVVARYLNDRLPNLTLTKTVQLGNDLLEPGDPLTYTIVIANQGLGNADQVILTDTLPAYIDGTGLSQTVDITAGQALTFTLPVTLAQDAPPGTTITNTAFFSHTLSKSQDAVSFIVGGEAMSERFLFLPTILKEK